MSWRRWSWNLALLIPALFAAVVGAPLALVVIFAGIATLAVLGRVVREAVADHFGLDPAAVDMGRPLSDSPVNADGLDVLELGEDIKERLEIPIPEGRWNQFLDEEAGSEPVRLTPAGLVRLFEEVGRTLGRRE